MNPTNITTIAFTIIVAVLVGMLIGYGVKANEYTPTFIKSISAKRVDGGGWETTFPVPLKTTKGVNYIFIVDMPQETHPGKAQEER